MADHRLAIRSDRLPLVARALDDSLVAEIAEDTRLNVERVELQELPAEIAASTVPAVWIEGPDAVSAAVAVGAGNLLDAFRRVEALHGIRGHSDFEALSLSYRRVKNILTGQEPPVLQEAALSAQEEKALLAALSGVEEKSAPLLSAGDYGAALRVMASLRSPLDRFFDKVLVMDPDPGIRASRLALLKRISLLFLRVGDFAEMVLEGENAAEPARGVKRG